MFTIELITTIITHSAVFILGIAFDRFVLSTVFNQMEPVEVKWGEIVKIIVLLMVFSTFMASVISAQFYSGADPSIWLSLGGVFSFGSLIGERDFFARLISGYVSNGKKENK